MKLSLVAEVPLPDGVEALHLPKTSLTAGDGALWGVVGVEVGDDWETWVVRADGHGLAHHALSAADVDDVFSGQAIVDVGGGSVAVVLSTEAVRVLDPACSVVADLVIEGAHEVRQAELEITPSTARGQRGGTYVLRLGSRFGARTLVPLRLDLAAGSASWGTPFSLDPSAYPVDRFGSDDFEGNGDPTPPIVGDVVNLDDGILVATEGSDEFVLRHGADYFTVDRVDDDGSVAARIHEQSGWKRMPGKHGWQGRITSNGDAVIVTPVFSSGEWKGKQRILRLADGSMEAPAMPRGASRSTLLDVRDGRAWLVDGGARLLCCDLLGE
ncbi:hypothetical protein [Aeromicrobium fastidiosum]|uniref:Uncharacterized protein n=1 Tax=Aeromicrobium fastidiosum TaxID=52699 RepID=A0A641AKM8_9ACTN|nr:hypothetical protein [Aeromicrobium fastidiosum]KAA1374870.1 hypothetical protein ESP62_015980 [Aeromicrobium fastidiosum]MBP2390565.1 hypothetical protein [Aeromicrobium fastidiosum]